VSVEISFESGSALGQRRFRLSHCIELPPLVAFQRELPLEGEALGRVDFRLPDGQRITTRALLHHDPEHPERGSRAELVDVRPDALLAIQTYIEQRSQP
jgi:hypothetical protein